MESLTTKSFILTPIKSNKPVLTTPVKPHQPVGPTVDTPDRVTNSSSRIRKLIPLETFNGRKDAPALLPEKYEMLFEFFDAVVSSIRLLRLKRQPATLTKLSRNIESLTDRRFTLNHLAQLKHIMPEVIVVKKTRVLGEDTCMKEDLLVSLDTSSVEFDKNAKGSGGYSDLKGIFHSRITNYAEFQSEEDGDVPEGELPELFYKQRQEPETSTDHASTVQSTTLMAPSFKRRFSSKTLSAPVQECSPVKPLPKTPVKVAVSDVGKDEYSMLTIDLDSTTPVKIASTPLKFDTRLSKFVSTPVQAVSTPARLMTATPALGTPKRAVLADDVTIGLPNKSAKRRALKFDEICDDVDEQSCQDSGVKIDVQVHSSVASKFLLEVLPENLVCSLMEKESKTMEEHNPIVSQARKRQQLMTGVPKLFDMIQLLFQSIRRSAMTKEELIYKIISGHLDIVDKGEVEGQLKLLQEIAPEFITEHSCLSGDTLVRLNKSTCAESIRAKLLEAS